MPRQKTPASPPSKALPTMASSGGLHSAIGSEPVPSGSPTRAVKSGKHVYDAAMEERIRIAGQSLRCFDCECAPCRCPPGAGLNQLPWNRTAPVAVVTESMRKVFEKVDGANHEDKLFNMMQQVRAHLKQRKSEAKDRAYVKQLVENKAAKHAELVDLFSRYRLALLAEEIAEREARAS